MKEHLEEEYISLDSLDNTQLMAQYFRNFDLDKNGQIDALELMKSLHRMNSKQYFGHTRGVLPVLLFHRKARFREGIN